MQQMQHCDIIRILESSEQDDLKLRPGVLNTQFGMEFPGVGCRRHTLQSRHPRAIST